LRWKRESRSLPKASLAGRGVAPLIGAFALVVACSPVLATGETDSAQLPPAGEASVETQAEIPKSPPTELSAEVKGAALAGTTVHLDVSLTNAAAEETPFQLLVDGEVVHEGTLAEGEQEIKAPLPPGRSERTITVATDGVSAETSARPIAPWLSILPPLIAIGLALLFKDVLLSLIAGIFAGALFLNHWNPFAAFGRTIDQFIVPSLADSGNASIIVFSCLLGGMVGVISRSGGTKGIVERLKPFATNARRGQVATWMMGILIFFDDYANTLIVGSTMRPVTDRLRISREKLAYIVDSTAAPIASVFPISTWIGFEVGLIAAALTQLGLDYNAYGLFIQSIAYRFYPIFALVLGFSIAFSCRDFGPMLKAETRATESGEVTAEDSVPLADYANEELTPAEGTPLRARNALLPILTVIIVTLVGLYRTGAGSVSRADYSSGLRWIQDVFSNADSFAALLWASLAGALVAMALAIGGRILTVRESTEALVAGFKAMFLAIIVLTLAWSIGSVCEALHTADYVVGLTEGVLSPEWLPVLVFFASAAIAFATGTSWGTMAILMPLVIPIADGLARSVGRAPGSEEFTLVLLGTISSVLAGSVWGDHCSPISDTTILSSMATGCDHIAHVRTQMPYALTAGAVAIVIGDLPTAFGMNPWIAIVLGSLIIIAIVRYRGRRSDWQADWSAESAD